MQDLIPASSNLKMGSHSAGSFEMTTPKTRTDWEDAICTNAKAFTVLRRAGRGAYDRREFSSFASAVADAKDDPRAMVYVRDDSQGCMIARAHWERVALLIPEGSK
jgi:hypothetical protein